MCGKKIRHQSNQDLGLFDSSLCNTEAALIFTSGGAACILDELTCIVHFPTPLEIASSVERNESNTRGIGGGSCPNDLMMPFSFSI